MISSFICVLSTHSGEIFTLNVNGMLVFVLRLTSVFQLYFMKLFRALISPS